MSPGMGFVRSLRHQSSVSSPEHPDISEPPRWANRGGPGAASGGALGAANRGRANRKGCVFLAPVLSRSPSHPDGISVSGKRLREPENPRSAPGRAAVLGSAGGTRGCDTWGAWVGGAGAIQRGSVPSWGQCHPEAEPRRSSLPRGCPRARCWGSGGLCLLRCRTLEPCLRPTAGTLVARCLHPCSLGFCTHIPRENPCSLGKRVKTWLGAGDRWLLPTEGWWKGVTWPWRVPFGVGAPVVRDHRSPWVQHLSPRAFLPASTSTSPRQARAPRAHSPRTPQTPWASVLPWAGAGSCF